MALKYKMLGTFPTNWEDPRAQRMIMEEEVARKAKGFVRSPGTASARWAGQDMDTRLAFAKLGIQKRMADDEYRMGQKKLRFEKDKLKSQADAFKWKLWTEIPTTALDIWKTNWQENRMDQMAADQAARDARLEQYQRMIALQGMTGPYAGLARSRLGL